MNYDWIYKLPIGKNHQENPYWYELGWRPIWFGTYYCYFTFNNLMKFFSSGWCKAHTFLGIRINKGGAHNGWGRSWEKLDIEIGLILLTLHFWLRWKIVVMVEGPQDVAKEDRKPLNISKRR